MLYSFIIYIISSLFFSLSPLISPAQANFNYGEIIKINQSNYFLEKKKNIIEPDISASSALVLDVNKDVIILEKNSDQVWPIASISKLMSVLVLLEDFSLDFEDYYKITSSDRRVGGRDYLFVGDEVKVADLLALSLIPSDNTAVVALISYLGLTEDEFVVFMNNKAEDIGLSNTNFKDATGLSSGNVSTARDVSLLIKKSFTKSEIVALVKKYNYTFTTKKGRAFTVVSTNELLNRNRFDDNIEIIGGKTGYNELAGYCLGIKFFLSPNQEFVSVVLNSSSSKNRFNDTQKIIEETKNFYNN